MKEKTQTIQEQQEYVDTCVSCSDELDQDKLSEKELVQTLGDQEKTISGNVESLEESKESDSQRVDELSESLVESITTGDSEKSEPLDKEKLAERLQRSLCYAYDVYLHAKKDGEHCPTVSIGDYVFAAWGFTCGRIDYVKVFKEIEKKVLFFFKKKEYVPVEVTKEIVNILAEAGGVLPPLDDETLLGR